jgi:hypothetical protein
MSKYDPTKKSAIKYDLYDDLLYETFLSINPITGERMNQNEEELPV